MGKTRELAATGSPRERLEGQTMGRSVAVLAAGALLVASLAAAAAAQTAPGGDAAGAQVQQEAAVGQGAGAPQAAQTPQAAIDYVNMMKARAALRDRAAAMREQTILQESGGTAPAPTK